MAEFISLSGMRLETHRSSAVSAISKGCQAGLLALLMIMPALTVAEPSPVESGAASSTPAAGGGDVGGDRLAMPRWQVDSRGQMATWLSEALPAKQVLWLNGAPGAPDAFLALYLPQAAGRNEGGGVILPDVGQHPAWPGLVSRLRHGLPERGWHSLVLERRDESSEPWPARRLVTIDQPDFPFPGAIPRPRPEAPSESPAPGGGETTPDARAQTNAETERLEVANNAMDPGGASSSEATEDVDASLVRKSAAVPALDNPDRIGHGLRQLSEFGLLNQALIGVGEGARDTVAYLGRQTSVPERGLVVVWINARFADDVLDPVREAGDVLARIPILDVQDGTDETVEAAAEARARFARRHQLANYRQLRFPRMTAVAPQGQDPLVSRIAGWLREVAPGRDVPDPAQPR